MKLLHLSDLHIGKRVHGFSMLEEQRYILKQVLAVVDEEEPEAILLAGDIYDKAVPSAEAVAVLDEFLTELHWRNIPVCLVSGNHDSPERLDFGGRILKEQGIYLTGCYDGETHMVEFADEYGPVRVYLLPFIRPSVVRPYVPEAGSYEEAVAAAIERMSVDRSVRNILVAHQFVVTGDRLPEVCESEELSLGTLDHVDASVFDAFDYVALGHIHGPQQVGRPEVRYAGSPLKYSFSERNHKKSVTLVTLGEKGKAEIRPIPLKPRHDMRQIQGTLEELLQDGLEQEPNDPLEYQAERMDKTEVHEDYISAILTDEGEVYDALGRLRAVYPNLMRLEFLRESREFERATVNMERLRSLTAVELFAEFYERQRQKPLDGESRCIVEKLVEELTQGGEGR